MLFISIHTVLLRWNTLLFFFPLLRSYLFGTKYGQTSQFLRPRQTPITNLRSSKKKETKKETRILPLPTEVMKSNRLTSQPISKSSPSLSNPMHNYGTKHARLHLLNSSTLFFDLSPHSASSSTSFLDFSIAFLPGVGINLSVSNYLKFYFSVSHPKALRSRDRDYL